jgi:sugar lactone lactonase YvrE
MKNSRIAVLLVVFSLLVVVVSVRAQVQDVGTVTTKVLVRGAPVHGTNGLAFDDQGHLYVASALGQEIVIMDPQTGKILERSGPEDRVVGPDDLAFGPDGSLYWTDILSGEVGRRTPDGDVTKQFVAEFVNPITFSDDGRLFVAQAFVGDGLFEIDPELVADPVKILGSGNPALHLNAMDFGPDGKLYAPRQQLNQIVRIDVDSAEVEVLTEQFEGACKFDSQGRLHVGLDDRVVRFDPSTAETTTVATLPSGGSDNLAFDSQDTLFVSNFRDGSIHEVLPGGNVRQVSPSGLILPGGIAALPDDRAGESIFVADWWSVRRFDGLTGKMEAVDNDFFFDAPVSAAPDGDNVILTSWFGNSVTVWNPETQEKLETHFGFAVPVNAIRFQGDFIVAELASGKLIRQDENGIRSDLATGLGIPTGLAATDDDLWVAEWLTGNVWKIVADGLTLDTPQLTATGLTLPEGLAVDHDGSLLVVESGIGRLSRIDPATGVVNTVADNLALGIAAPPGWPPTWIFNDVAVGEMGAIYVTGDVGSVIYRIDVRPQKFITKQQ